jgi:RNA-binding protein
MDKKLRIMRSESKNLTPKVIIGKNGLTEQVIKNIKDELSKHKLVKLKILQSYMSDKDKNNVFKEIVERTGAKIVQKIGFTITLTKF